MKVFGMKSLSLAVLGLVGFGMASAQADLPYPFNAAAGGAWSLQTTNTTLAGFGRSRVGESERVR